MPSRRPATRVRHVADLPLQGELGPAITDLSRLVTDQLPGAVVAVDLCSRVVHWNAGAVRLYGWAEHEALGRSVRELMLARSQERADEVVAATRAGSGWDGEFAAVRKDGTGMTVWVSNTPLRDDAGRIVGVVGVSLEVTDHSPALRAREAQVEQARRYAERLADRNARLVEVSGALGRALTPEQVVDVVLTQGIEALGADAGGVAVIDGERLHVVGSVGYEVHMVEAYRRLELDAVSPLTDVARIGLPLHTSSAAELQERYPHLPHSSMSESFAGVPLEVDGAVLGVMGVSAQRPDAFDRDELDFIATLGRQCAQALRRGRLFEAEQGARRRMGFLAMASARLSASLDYRSTLDAVAELAVPATADWCSVHLLDDNGRPQLVTVHHRDHGLQELLEELFEKYPPDPDRGSGIGQAVGERRTVHHRSFSDQTLEAIARDPWHLDALHRLGLGSALVVPLTVTGRILGVLTLTRGARDAYDEQDVRLAEDLATRMATAVDNALHYRQERETALTLQRSLMPRDLPELPGLCVAARYLPGTAGAEVGGDWYDVIALPGGRVGLVIGDVMGRGIAAAAVMGQVRAAVRAYAMVEHSPAVLLGLVDAAMSSLQQASLTTCVYGVFDPATRLLRLASAGHLPPMVVHHDGGGEYVEIDPGPPLGAAWQDPPEIQVQVPDGAVLLLYTDGLVEGRTQPVEDGMLALRNAVASVAADDVDQLCDALLRAMGRDGRPDDDSALLAVSMSAPASATPAVQDRNGDVHLHLAGHLSEVARARRLAGAWAAAAGADADDVALLVTELASNALRHGGPGVDLWLRRPSARLLRVELIDGRASSLPMLQTPGEEDEGGRGLVLVAALAQRWGSDRLAAGKCVWFELGVPAGG
jgi:PAS domain S-box-containing protein